MPTRSLPRLCAALLLVSGCNLPSAALIAAAQSDGAPAPGVAVQFRPGVPLLSVAAEAPAAFDRLRGAAARLGLDQPLFGDGSVSLTGELLQGGMLLPMPMGTLSIRTIPPEEVAVTAIPVEAVEVAEVSEDAPHSLADLVGVYGSSTTSGLLILSTDGTYLIRQHSHRMDHGTYSLQGRSLVLLTAAGEVQRLQPHGRDAWARASVSADGEVYAPLHPTDERVNP